MSDSVAIIGGGGLLGTSLQRRLTSSKTVIYSSKQSSQVRPFDIGSKDTWDPLLDQAHKKVILLSWRHLDDYHTRKHITENLLDTIQLVEQLIDRGLEELVVAGTCYEYGLKTGCLSSTLETQPVTTYGLAKDLLNKSLTALCAQSHVRLCWTRIFFPYSPRQRSSSLLPSLLMAHKNGVNSLNLGPEDLIRDFVPIQQVVAQIIALINNDSLYGVFNCGTGVPTSLRTFVESMISKYSLNVKPIFNQLAPRPFEPFAAWADMSCWD